MREREKSAWELQKVFILCTISIDDAGNNNDR